MTQQYDFADTGSLLDVTTNQNLKHGGSFTTDGDITTNTFVQDGQTVTIQTDPMTKQVLSYKVEADGVTDIYGPHQFNPTNPLSPIGDPQLKATALDGNQVEYQIAGRDETILVDQQLVGDTLVRDVFIYQQETATTPSQMFGSFHVVVDGDTTIISQRDGMYNTVGYQKVTETENGSITEQYGPNFGPDSEPILAKTVAGDRTTQVFNQLNGDGNRVMSSLEIVSREGHPTVITEKDAFDNVVGYKTVEITDQGQQITKLYDPQTKALLMTETAATVYADENGNQILTKSYQFEGSDDTIKVTEQITANNFTTRTIEQLNDKGEFVKGSTIITDTDGKPQLMVERTSEGMKQTTYQDGQVAKEVITDSEGNVTATKSYQYNEKGQLDQEIITDGQGISTTKTYHYNQDGQLHQEIVTNSKDDEIATKSYHYEGGQLSQVSVEQGNWLYTIRSDRLADPSGQLSPFDQHMMSGPLVDGAVNAAFNLIYQSVLANMTGESPDTAEMVAYMGIAFAANSAAGLGGNLFSSKIDKLPSWANPATPTLTVMNTALWGAAGGDAQLWLSSFISNQEPSPFGWSEAGVMGAFSALTGGKFGNTNDMLTSQLVTYEVAPVISQYVGTETVLELFGGPNPEQSQQIFGNSLEMTLEDKETNKLTTSNFDLTNQTMSIDSYAEDGETIVEKQRIYRDEITNDIVVEQLSPTPPHEVLETTRVEQSGEETIMTHTDDKGLQTTTRDTPGQPTVVTEFDTATKSMGRIYTIEALPDTEGTITKDYSPEIKVDTLTADELETLEPIKVTQEQEGIYGPQETIGALEGSRWIERTSWEWEENDGLEMETRYQGRNVESRPAETIITLSLPGVDEPQKVEIDHQTNRYRYIDPSATGNRVLRGAVTLPEGEIGLAEIQAALPPKLTFVSAKDNQTTKQDRSK